MITKLISMLIVLSPLLAAAQQSTTGNFALSPNDHIIDDAKQPFVVRSIKGLISMAGGNDEPLRGLLFVIPEPDNHKTIRRATTDDHGRFRILDVPPGRYRFKTTLMSFQALMGTILVTKKAGKRDMINIELHVGT